MNRNTFAAVSLIAAVPGAFMAYLLVMAFVNRFESMAGMFRIVSGLTLLVSAFLTVLPIGIIVFWPKTEEDEEPATEESDQVQDESPEPSEPEEPVAVAASTGDQSLAEGEDLDAAGEPDEDVYVEDPSVEMDFEDFMSDDDEKS